MKSIKYLVGIHTCRAYWPNVVDYVWKSSWFGYLRKRQDVKIIYFWGKEDYSLEKLPHKDIVELPCKEGYDQLAAKTFASVQWAVENYEFEYLLKFDDNKDFYEPHVFFETMETEKADYVVTNANPCSYRTFIRWFNKKRIKVSAKYFDPKIIYSAWKPYATSWNFANMINQHGRTYANMYVKHLGGCEDHMIGKIFSDHNKGGVLPESALLSPPRKSKIRSLRKGRHARKKAIGAVPSQFLSISKLGRYNVKKHHPGLHQPGTIHTNNRS